MGLIRVAVLKDIEPVRLQEDNRNRVETAVRVLAEKDFNFQSLRHFLLHYYLGEFPTRVISTQIVVPSGVVLERNSISMEAEDRRVVLINAANKYMSGYEPPYLAIVQSGLYAPFERTLTMAGHKVERMLPQGRTAQVPNS